MARVRISIQLSDKTILLLEFFWQFLHHIAQPQLKQTIALIGCATGACLWPVLCPSSSNSLASFFFPARWRWCPADLKSYELWALSWGCWKHSHSHGGIRENREESDDVLCKCVFRRWTWNAFKAGSPSGKLVDKCWKEVLVQSVTARSAVQPPLGLRTFGIRKLNTGNKESDCKCANVIQRVREHFHIRWDHLDQATECRTKFRVDRASVSRFVVSVSVWVGNRLSVVNDKMLIEWPSVWTWPLKVFIVINCHTSVV